MPYTENILEIYKTEYNKYEKTRGIQWKMNVAIWTLLAALTYYTSKGELNLNTYPAFVKYGIGLTFLIAHWYFLFEIQCSLNRSLYRMDKIGEMIAMNKSRINWVEFKNPQTEPKKCFKPPRKKYWVAVQLTITILMAVIFVLVNKNSCH